MVRLQYPTPPKLLEPCASNLYPLPHAFACMADRRLMAETCNGIRVLLVDDSMVMRRILENALRLAVPNLTEVLHAANGEQGLTALHNSATANQPLSLILCDLHMPQLDGLDFMLRMQQLKLAQDVPLLMITADAGDPRVLQSVAAGARGILTKPFTLQQVQERVVSLLHAGANNKARNYVSSGPAYLESSPAT